MYSVGTSTFPGASPASASLSTVVSTHSAAPKSERLAALEPSESSLQTN